MLERFAHAVTTKDIDAVLAIMTEDGMIIGSDPEEKGFGPGMRPFLEHVFGALPPIVWEWDTWETREEETHAWFLVEGRVKLDEEVAPYRASGVCREVGDGEWRLAMFHGTSPG